MVMMMCVVCTQLAPILLKDAVSALFLPLSYLCGGFAGPDVVELMSLEREKGMRQGQEHASQRLILH